MTAKGIGGIYYRLSQTEDPEERLEDASLWKAMHDEYGDAIKLLASDAQVPETGVFFGRSKWGESFRQFIRYWDDPAFLRLCGREFSVQSLDGAKRAVDRLHSIGKGAFVKATDHKLMVLPVPLGSSFLDALGDMAYSFCDHDACLMVQELAQIRFEHRFFVINREIVCESPIQIPLTPLDAERAKRMVAPTPSSPLVRDDLVYQALSEFAETCVDQIGFDHYSLDLAMVNGRPGIVELNSMHLGQLGLYAADVRALAEASRHFTRGG